MRHSGRLLISMKTDQVIASRALWRGMSIIKIKQYRLIQKRNKKAIVNLTESGVFVAYQPETQAEVYERQRYVFKALQTLEPRQKLILQGKYGFFGNPVPLKQLATQINVTYETVRKDHRNLLISLAQDPDLQSQA